MTKLRNIIEDALIDGRIICIDSKNTIVKRMKNIIQKCAPDIEGVDDRKNIHVLIYDADDETPFLPWVSGCFQKIQDKKLVYSSVHRALASVGRVVIILITA